MARSPGSELNLPELQAQIGLSDESTLHVLDVIQQAAPAHSLLPICNLMLLEHYDKTVPLIRAIMEKQLDLQYIVSLQRSRFSLQRRCAAAVADLVPADARRGILQTSLADASLSVVADAVASIERDNPYEKKELLAISEELLNHPSSERKVLGAVLFFVFPEDGETFSQLISSQLWRVRTRCAIFLPRLPDPLRARAIEALQDDPVEEVRENLARNIATLDVPQYLTDPCSSVRMAYLQNVYNLLDESELIRLSNDECWEVQKILLNLRGEYFKKITIPLIQDNLAKVPWRTRINLLSLLEEHAKDALVAAEILGILVHAMRDKVCAVRDKAAEAVIRLLEACPWCKEYAPLVEEIVGSENYLHRITVIPVAKAFDELFGTDFIERLKSDSVENVRWYAGHYSRAP